MSKKDYVAIANVIIKVHNNYNVHRDYDKAMDVLIDSLCQVFKRDNSSFNEDKFYTYLKEGLTHA